MSEGIQLPFDLIYGNSILGINQLLVVQFLMKIGLQLMHIDCPFK
jgi:hypothetical protein